MRRFPLATAALACVLLSAHPPARAQEPDDPGRKILQARERLRTGSVEDRREAIRLLIGVDTSQAISLVEEAILRSAGEMDKLAKDVDTLDGELADAEQHLEWVMREYPSSAGEARARVQAARSRFEDLTRVMQGHLGICVEGPASLAAFTTEEALDRLARGAASSTAPMMRQMYIQALATPGKESRLPVLLDLLKAGESRVRSTAVRSLKAFPPRREILEAVAPLLADRHWAVRIGAAEVVARMPLDLAVPLLAACAEKETGEPALQVDSLLHSLTGVSMGTTGKAWPKWWKDNEEAIREGTRRRPEPKAEAEDGGTRTEAFFFSIPVESDNLLVVLDLSSSMNIEVENIDGRTQALLDKHGYGGSRLAVALVQAYQMVDDLPQATRFSLATFSDKVTRFTTRGIPATVSAKKRSVAWLNNQKCGWCTNIWDALRQSFGDHMGAGGASRFEELPDTLIFLTDGSPTFGRFRDQESLENLVSLWNASAGVAIHCVGIGSGYAAGLLKSIATSTGGYFMDAGTKRLVGTRARPSVPPEERCREVQGMATDLWQRFEGAGAEERLALVGRIVGACTFSDDAFRVVVAALQDGDAAVVARAAQGLATLGEPGVARLATALDGGHAEAAIAAARAIPRSGAAAATAVPALASAASRAGGPCRPEAIRALGEIGPAAAGATAALEAIAAGGGDLAKEALKALERIRAKSKSK